VPPKSKRVLCLTRAYESENRFRASITLTVPSPANPVPVRVSPGVRPAVPLQRQLLVATIGSEFVICDNQQLPLPDGSIQRLRCVGMFEFVMDDQLLMREAARILAAGARIEITVPNARGLGRLDWLNALRYLRDTSGCGGPIPKLAEIGWRRHYAPAELAEMMVRAGFQNIRIQRVGLGPLELRMFRNGMIGRLARRRTPTSHLLGNFSIAAILGARIVATATRPA